MKVQIEGNLYLESDGMQFIIKRYIGSKDKNGNDLYNTLGYFSSLEHAIKHLIKLKVMESTAQTLKELLEDVKRIKSDVESMVYI